MTKRERILAIGVGSVLLLVVTQWAFNRYRDARKTRDQEITRLEGELQNAQLVQQMGLDATDRMAGFIDRSLPSDGDRAVGEYAAFLLTLMEASGVSDTDVKNLQSVPSGDLYRTYSYRVSATGDMEEIVWLLHAFHRTDYLHRIRNLSIKPTRTPGLLNVALSVDALALNEAAVNQPPPKTPSPMVEDSVAAYANPILDRNFFSPPNQPPRFAGRSSVEAVVEKDFAFKPKFEDPDGDDVEIRLVGELPDGVRFDSRSGEVLVRSDTLGSLALMIEATDTGRPNRTVRQPLAINVVNPPPPPETTQPLKFDHATQAFLTGLVYSRGSWVAWLTVRTKPEKLELRKGDAFEVGSVKGTVIDVTGRFLEVEVDDRRFTMRLDGNLANAAKQSLID